MRIELGYPAPALERQLLLGRDRRDLLADLTPAISPQQLLRLQAEVPKVHASDALLDYVQAVARYTRQAPEFETGLSPRAVIALLRAAQAWAFMHGARRACCRRTCRPCCRPSSVTGSRRATRRASATPARVGQHVLAAVPVP